MTGRRPPPLVGRYVLVDRIGAGGMGTVWRAHDLRRDRLVAVKVLGRHDGDLLLRFVREQSLRIRHPHVVAPTGWAAEDDLVVLTMDLVGGGSLDTLLAEHGPLPEPYVAVLLDQLLQALAAIHAAGLVHRDIKPANLLLEATGTGRPWLRVGDFGVAASVDDVRLTPVPVVVGTDGYLPPEQLPGSAPDPTQDLYAAGVVAARLLTGRPPGRTPGRSPGRSPQRPGTALPPPGRLSPLVAALTSQDPRARPPSAQAALDLLRRIGVPGGAPWLEAPDRPPDVVDRLPPAPVPTCPTAYALPIACFVLSILLSAAAAYLAIRGPS